MANIILSVFLTILSFDPVPTPEKGTLLINVLNLEVPDGDVHIAVYDREDHFMDAGKSIAGKVIPVVAAGTVQVQLPGLAFGDYALAVYHDRNENGVLDANAFGIPTEPYAFSNNISVKWRSPRFQEARFELGQPQQVLDIRLKHWEDY